MGIGIQGEACREVTQHAGHCLDVYSVLEGNGSEGMAEVMVFLFYVGRCPEWVQFRLFLCKAEAADGCGTLSCGLFVAVMSRCFAGTKQMAGAE